MPSATASEPGRLAAAKSKRNWTQETCPEMAASVRALWRAALTAKRRLCGARAWRQSTWPNSAARMSAVEPWRSARRACEQPWAARSHRHPARLPISAAIIKGERPKRHDKARLEWGRRASKQAELIPAAASAKAESPRRSTAFGLERGASILTMSFRPSQAADMRGVRPSIAREKALPGLLATRRSTRLGRLLKMADARMGSMAQRRRMAMAQALTRAAREQDLGVEIRGSLAIKGGTQGRKPLDGASGFALTSGGGSELRQAKAAAATRLDCQEAFRQQKPASRQGEDLGATAVPSRHWPSIGRLAPRGAARSASASPRWKPAQERHPPQAEQMSRKATMSQWQDRPCAYGKVRRQGQ